MKKRVIMTICILVMVLLAGCGKKDSGPGREMDRMQRQERDGFGENTNTRLDFADCEFQIPSYFLYEKGISTERNRFFYAEHDVSLSMLHLAYVAKDWTKEEYLNLKDEIAESSVQGVTSTEVVSVRDVLIAGRDGKNIVMDGVIDDFNVRINQYFFYDEGIGKLIILSLYQSENTDYSYWNDYQKIINAIHVPDAAAGTSPPADEALTEEDSADEALTADSAADGALTEEDTADETPTEDGAADEMLTEDGTAGDAPGADDVSSPEGEDESGEIDPETDETVDVGEVSPAFKQTMDSYESFIDDYIAFSKNYEQSDDVSGMLGDSMMFIVKYAQIMNEMNAVETTRLSKADYTYYMEVMQRISEKLGKAGL